MGEKKKMGQVISIDEKLIKDHLGELVRGTVEDTLNGMLIKKRTGSAARESMNAHQTDRITAPAITSAT